MTATAVIMSLVATIAPLIIDSAERIAGALPIGTVTNYTNAGISKPIGITTGSDGNLWYTNALNPAIGRITPPGVVTTFTGPGIGAAFGITAGPDANLWFTNTNSIGRITTSGSANSYTAATITSPVGITAGPDGNLWFADNGKIGRITVGGVATAFPDPTINNARLIVPGADGNLWFTNGGNNSIGRITTTGVVSNFTGVGISQPRGIAAGPDGNLWFTNPGNHSIGRITTGGTVTNFTSGTINQPGGIATGPDGALWFTNFGNNTIGRITTAGTVTNFAGAGIGGPTEIAKGPDGGMWFTNYSNNSIGRITAANVPDAPIAVSGVAGNTQVSVSWAAPLLTGGAPITGYTVTSTPGGQTCTWTTGPLNCSVLGLANGTPYTFAVTATNEIGIGPPSLPSGPVTPGTVPDAPASLSATGAKQSASVSWSAPANNGGATVTSYTVTASPGGATCSWSAGPLACVVPGLTAGSSYTFSVFATNSFGPGQATAESNTVTPWDGAGYHPLAPSRILDSRTTNGGWNGKLVVGTPRNLQVTGRGGASNVPATASAVVMNVTATNGDNGSFITVWPTGSAQPTASNLNFGPGETIPNLVTVKLGIGGQARFANEIGTVHVIVDVVGYYDDGNGAGDLNTTITPTRLLDSRTVNGGWSTKLAAGVPRDLSVRSPENPNGVPASATAVIANVTATNGTAGSFLSVWPSGTSQPNVSNLNFAAGQTIPNLTIIKIGDAGAIRFANEIGAVDVVVDVVGYFDPTTGSRFHAINPTRVLDDRIDLGLPGPWGPHQTRALEIAGAPGTNVPGGATGLVANVTATNGTTGSFVTVFPNGVAKPNSSNLNFGPGQTIPNLVTVGLAANGKIDLYNELGYVDLVADAVGYYNAT